MDEIMKFVDQLNCNVFSTVSQAEDEEGWLAARRMGIGGSDVGPIAGMSRWASPRDIYYSKVSEEEQDFDDASLQRMHFGHMLEPVVAEEFARRHEELQVVDIDITLQHPEKEWALCNMDRLLVKDGKPYAILECKTSSEFMNEQWESMEIPEQYIAQVQWYMYVADLDFAYIAALVGGNKYYEYGIPRDDEMIRKLVECSEDFVEMVKSGVAPDATDVDDSAISEKHSEVVCGATIAVSADIEEKMAALVEVKRHKSEVTKLEKELSAQIKEALGENEFGVGANYEVAWSPRTSNRIDSKALRENFPEVAEAVTKKSSYRVLSVKPID